MSLPVATLESFGDGPPTLVIEVPHGADEQHHYDTVRAALHSPLPAHLEKFFWVNTDVGAYAIGRRIAELAAAQGVATLVLRSLIPRTFIDVNRTLDGAEPGMTPGLQPYITDPRDQALLLELHHRYTAAAEAAYSRVLPGGFAVIPHTYAPHTVPITVIDADIVKNLERVYEPAILQTCPLRPEVDLITRTPEGIDQSPPGAADALLELLAAQGIQGVRDDSYNLHPATMGRAWSDRWPGRILCFEVRRDLVTDWNPFAAKPMRPDRIDPLAGMVVQALGLGDH